MSAPGVSSASQATVSSRGVTLHCRSVTPPGPPWALLGIVHGYGDHGGRYQHLQEWLAACGVASHALDLRGHGLSGGRRGYVTRWEDYLDDLHAFILFLLEGGGRGSQSSVVSSQPRAPGGQNEEPGTSNSQRPTPTYPHTHTPRPPVFLLGHSHGALVVAAGVIRGVAGVAGCVLSAPYFRSNFQVPRGKVMLAHLASPVLPWLRVPSGLKHEWMSSDEVLQQQSRSDPLLLRCATPRWYVRKLAAQAEVMRRAPEFHLPVLMLMGDRDPVADPRAAHDFYLRAGSADKTYRVYPDHLHELLREAGREAIFTHIHHWLRERAGRG